MKTHGGKTQKQITLIATLGSEPQVVTTAYDLLVEKGLSLSKLIILHTSGGERKVDQAVEVLRRELPAYAPDLLEVKFQPLQSPSGIDLKDIDSPGSVQSYFRMLYQLVWQEKRSEKSVHLCIAGGRKTMAVYGMSVAQLLFDETDYLWHLFSSGEFLSSKRMHPAYGDEVRLVRIPVISWSSITPVLTGLRDVEDPYLALERIKDLQLKEKYEAARIFVLGQLTPAERRVVGLLVEEGLSDIEIAERLVVSPRTVEQHLRSAYHKAEMHWETGKVTRSQLIAFLQYFFSTQIREIPDDERG